MYASPSYPQFFPRSFTDTELVKGIRVREEPLTSEGKMLAAAIKATAAAHADSQGPCAFDAWKGSISGTTIRVMVEETESNAKLCGPACANEIFVHQGSILGLTGM